jgi:hypothetical protein
MIWLTWRQFRTQALVAAAGLAAFGVLLAVTAPRLLALSRDTGFAACRTRCDDVGSTFLAQAHAGLTGKLYMAGIGVMFLVPALIGIFWGAPLVAREFEAGTHRLIWNQTIGRGRWLGVKLAGIGLAAVLTSGLFSAAVTWWAGPIDRAGGDRLLPQYFAVRDVVPLGYAAFAFVAGVTVGLLLRRTLVAMAVTLLVLVTAQIATPFLVRERLSEPVRETMALNPAALDMIGTRGTANEVVVHATVPHAGAWALSNETIDSTGHVYAGPLDPVACGMQSPRDACTAWLGAQNLRQRIVYFPADRYWTLQWRELGVYAAATALLSIFSLWWVRRRVT